MRDIIKQKLTLPVILMIVWDVLAVYLAYFFALMLRFEFSFNLILKYIPRYLHRMPWFCLLTIVVFFAFRLYHSLWAYASTMELLRMMEAYLVIIGVLVIGILITRFRMPYSFYIIGVMTAAFLHTAMRFSFRFVRSVKKSVVQQHAQDAERTMVIGGGDAARVLIREILNSDHITRYKLVCVIDDDAQKRGKFIEGIPITGNRGDIVKQAKEKQIRSIIYAIPSASPEDRKEIFNLCNETGCTLKTVPGIYEIINGEIDLQMLRDVTFEDLLGREPVHVYNEEVFEMIYESRVLVTGGGGSIGSELCRQIAEHSPEQLIIFDIYENNAYAIEQELRMKYPDLNLVVLIGSVRNTHRIDQVMQEYRPEIVYHAAAHKHVPLMEVSPNEAIKNNVMGTWKTAEAAVAAGVKKFVLISTDKAVNPTNVMGASKRICEMLVQAMGRKAEGTDFVAVRFGNVLGSNGSVIPLFKEQIANGGPVTVTDKRIIRYFMTIPEAVSLVLQASFYATGGEIFVLDMGEPVKIDDMARKLIRLSGYEPDVDIQIVYTGLREGEKLYEEMLMEEEGLRDTPNQQIHIGQPIEMDDAQFFAKLRELDEKSKEDSNDIRGLISEVVPTYTYQKKN